MANDAQLEMLGIPGCDRDRVGYIEGDMLDFHMWIECLGDASTCPRVHCGRPGVNLSMLL